MRACIEPLERRTLFTAFVVTTLADSTATDGQVSLREAITAANTNAAFGDAAAGQAGATDRITFSPSLIGGTITLNGTRLLITDDLEIDGQGDAIVVDADNQSQVMVIDGAQVTVRGLELTNGRAETGGAVSIIGESNVSLVSMAVTNSLATGRGGGGIYLGSGSTLEFTASAVRGNVAVGFGQTHGGGIYADTGSGLSVTASVVEKNYATGDGGGIYSDSDDMIVTGSTISQNAIFNQAGNQGGGGGGIAFVGGDGDILNSQIIGNSLLDSSNTGGGGIHVASTDVTITNCDITDNGVYGAVFGGGVHAVAGSVVTINTTDILRNVSAGGGGGIFASGTFTVKGSLIEQNQAAEDGGGVYVALRANATFSDSTIRGNSANDGYGGGIFWDDVTSVLVQRCTVSFNYASGGGGGIYSGDNASTDRQSARVLNSTIANNYTPFAGGGIFGVNFYVNGCSIHDNYAVTNGGGLSIGGFKMLGSGTSVDNTQIYRNYGGAGGGIYTFDVIGMLNINVFNNAAVSGGGIYSGDTVPAQYFHDNTPDNIVYFVAPI